MIHGRGFHNRRSPAGLIFSFAGGTLDSRITASGGANGSRVNSSGVISAASAPRFDYDPVTLAARGVLIEGTATNLSFYSSDFTNAAWTKNGITVTANATTAPDGTATAQKFVEDTSTGNHRAYQVITVASGTTYADSVYLKAAGRTQAYVLETTLGGAFIDLTTGAISGGALAAVAKVSNAGNGWWRLSMPATTSSTLYVLQICAAVSGTNSYTGDGASGIYVWGAGLEAGAFATSCIPTTSAAVTRSADAISFTVPGNVRNLIYTFDDGSTQTVSVSPGAYTVPTNLNRSRILSIRGV